MEILLYIYLFVLSVFGLAVASKIVVYCGTMAFLEAKYNFVKKLMKNEKENKEKEEI